MPKRFFLYIVGLFFLLSFTACVTPEKKKLPEFMPVSEGKIPQDAKLAAAAILTRINGFDLSKEFGISFKDGAAADIDNPEYKYTRFTIKSSVNL